MHHACVACPGTWLMHPHPSMSCPTIRDLAPVPPTRSLHALPYRPGRPHNPAFLASSLTFLLNRDQYRQSTISSCSLFLLRNTLVRTSVISRYNTTCIIKTLILSIYNCSNAVDIYVLLFILEDHPP